MRNRCAGATAGAECALPAAVSEECALRLVAAVAGYSVAPLAISNFATSVAF